MQLSVQFSVQPLVLTRHLGIEEVLVFGCVTIMSDLPPIELPSGSIGLAEVGRDCRTRILGDLA